MSNKLKADFPVTVSLKQSETKVLTDDELVHLVKEGDRNAFRKLMNKYKEIITFTVRGMLGVTVEADDVVQEVFIRFYNSIDYFRGDASLKTYLTRIAINLSINEQRRRKRNRFIRLDALEEKKIGKQSVEDKQNEMREIISLGLDNLSPKLRSVLVLRLIDGFSTEETAESLKIPIGTVLSRLARAQNKMRNFLGPLLEK